MDKKLQRLDKATLEMLHSVQELPALEESRIVGSLIYDYEKEMAQNFGREWVLKQYSYNRKQKAI